MKTLLRIDASARTNGSHSRMLADYYQNRWEHTHPRGEVISRDLATNPVPHLSDDMIEAFQSAGNKPSPSTELSSELIHELKTADHLLVSSPLYNLTLPSTLKAYFDYVVRSDLTFRAQGEQYIGMLSGKSATVITARGSVASDDVADDFQSEYLRGILSYMGFGPVDMIALEGTALEELDRARYVNAAKQQIDRSLPPANEPLWIGPFSDEEKTAIAALRDGQASAIVKGDAAAYAELCAPDIQLMIPGRDTVTGRDQLLLTEEDLFRSASFTAFTKRPERIERGGDMIVETGRQEVTMSKPSNEGGVFASRQKYLHMFRRTSAGWRYAVLMSNQSE